MRLRDLITAVCEYAYAGAEHEIEMGNDDLAEGAFADEQRDVERLEAWLAAPINRAQLVTALNYGTTVSTLAELLDVVQSCCLAPPQPQTEEP